MSKRKKWTVVMAVIVILSVIGLVASLVALCETQQVRQTLCTLRCQHIENEAAWEVCVGECLVEIANDQ